ncbi:hypothetical protein BpHYR1_034150 [Brachionus plicatilis]|uniref:Uncharacterized protein n=1 Tax=Brachionus plicatilis TaxID=10195 RepID=A0A3M7S6V2_BRAPC|nr:hypothetical protein BpHYR1_034150 [Brachionus plicatilis]
MRTLTKDPLIYLPILHIYPKKCIEIEQIFDKNNQHSFDESLLCFGLQSDQRNIICSHLVNLCLIFEILDSSISQFLPTPPDLHFLI